MEFTTSDDSTFTLTDFTKTIFVNYAISADDDITSTEKEVDSSGLTVIAVEKMNDSDFFRKNRGAIYQAKHETIGLLCKSSDNEYVLIRAKRLKHKRYHENFVDEDTPFVEISSFILPTKTALKLWKDGEIGDFYRNRLLTTEEAFPAVEVTSTSV